MFIQGVTGAPDDPPASLCSRVKSDSMQIFMVKVGFSAGGSSQLRYDIEPRGQSQFRMIVEKQRASGYIFR